MLLIACKQNCMLNHLLAGHLTRLFALQGLRIDESTAMYYLNESGGDLKRAVRLFGESLDNDSFPGSNHDKLKVCTLIPARKVAYTDRWLHLPLQKLTRHGTAEHDVWTLLILEHS